ncbi:radical SAM protein [Nanoarchaeota archaeon]
MITTSKIDRLLKFYKNAEKEKFLGLSALYLLQYYITHDCNLDCGYCDLPKSSEASSEESTRTIIEHSQTEFDIPVINFIGGEPLLREDLINLIEYANSFNMISSISTNGSLLDERFIDSFAKAGGDFIYVSLDGVDSINSSKKTLAEKPDLIDLLTYAKDEHGIIGKIHCVITPYNLDEIHKLVEEVAFNISISFGLVNQEPLIRQDPAISGELQKIVDYLIKEKDNGALITTPLHYLNGIPNYLADDALFEDCGIGLNAIQIDIDGKIFKCAAAGSKSNANFLDMTREKYLGEANRNIRELKGRYCLDCTSLCGFFARYNAVNFHELVEIYTKS